MNFAVSHRRIVVHRTLEYSGSAVASLGQVAGKLSNPRTGTYAMTWNDFTPAPGGEATLTMDLPKSAHNEIV